MAMFPATKLYREEKIDSLFLPDTLVPHQYFRTLHRTDPLGPEQKLLLAVLEDAVFCFQKYISARDRRGKRLFQEAQDWFFEEKNEWSFSFRNTCELLGLNPVYVSEGLMHWKKRRLRALARMKTRTSSAGRIWSLAGRRA